MTDAYENRKRKGPEAIWLRCLSERTGIEPVTPAVYYWWYTAELTAR